VSPLASPPHQRISRRLANAFDPGAEAVGLEVLEAVNIRLKPGRIPIPDIVVVEPVGPDPVIDASVVRLVCEIVSPSNPATDRVLKMHYYAEAKIPFYLLVQDRPRVTLSLSRLDSDGYREECVATPGHPLRMTEPFRLTLDPADLERPPGRPVTLR
jgi:Uma2 family endonuclease